MYRYYSHHYFSAIKKPIINAPTLEMINALTLEMINALTFEMIGALTLKMINALTLDLLVLAFFTRLCSRRVVMCLVVVYVRSFPHTHAGI